MMSGNEKGYILVATIVMTVILSISMAYLTEKWESVVKREKENELLFRGQQYASAIRRFYLSHKRYPFKLEELVTTNPRCIRRLYKNPFDKEGEWKLIYLSDLASGKVYKKSGNKSQTEDNTPNPQPVSSIFPKSSGNTVGVGQIVGVYCDSKDRPFKDYMKGETYSDWKFIAPVTTKKRRYELKRSGQ